MKKQFILALVIAVLCQSAFADEVSYRSPVDGKLYQADWRTYHPSNQSAKMTPPSRVQLQGVRLLSTQDEFSRNIDVSKFAEYIRKTGKAIELSLGTSNEQFELAVQTTLSKNAEPFFELASQGDVSRSVLQQIYDEFKRLPDYRSSGDKVMYEVRFTVSNKP